MNHSVKKLSNNKETYYFNSQDKTILGSGYLGIILFEWNLRSNRSPFKVVHNNSNEEVDEDEVFQHDESNQVNKDVPVVRVFLLYFRVHQKPIV